MDLEKIPKLKEILIEKSVGDFREFVTSKVKDKGLEGEAAQNHIVWAVDRYRFWVEKSYDLE